MFPLLFLSLLLATATQTARAATCGFAVGSVSAGSVELSAVLERAAGSLDDPSALETAAFGLG